ncbi:MAG: hypothetical protein FJZ07_00015 [Candidatus Nealsonbacteria bacterium]|nr:hypothetical protein [Candidatus Nealsonbacteria bacterium]
MPYKKIIVLLVALTMSLGPATNLLIAAPAITSVTVTTNSARIVFDQSDMITAVSDEENYAQSVNNFSNYFLQWGADDIAYPLAGMPEIFTNYVSEEGDGVANIFGLNLTQNNAYKLTISNIANTSLEAVSPTTFDGIVAASTNPVIDYIENITGTAQTNNCYGYPCGKAGEQIRINGTGFDTTTGVEIYGLGDVQSTSATSTTQIILTIPDASVGNNGIRVKNLDDNTFSNTKYFGTYYSTSGDCGVIKGTLTNSGSAVGGDQNNVPVRLESWHQIYGESKSHSNGYYAVVGYSNNTCQIGSFDVRFTTPAGATEAAPSEVSSQSVSSGSVTNAGAKAFNPANVTGYVKGPLGTSDENVGMNMVTITVYNDSWSVQRRATTDKNGFFKVNVPVTSTSNYYTIEAEPNTFYRTSPYSYQRAKQNITISQGGSALNQTIRFAVKNVSGTLKTPSGNVSTSNPVPNTVVPNAPVGIHTQDWSINEWTNTGSDGTFSFGVPAGSNYVLEIEPPWGDATFGVYSKNTYSGLTIESTLTNLDTLISGGPRLAVSNIFGRVMAGGSPMANAFVGLNREGYWSGVNTDSEGRFSFAVSQSGNYYLNVNSVSSAYSNYNAEVSISSSEVTSGKNLGDIVLSAPNVTGKIYDPSGLTPQANIGLDICPYNAPGTCYWGQTNENGLFGIGIVPDGTWQLNVKIWGASIYGSPAAILIEISDGSVTSVSGGATNLNDIRLADPTINGLLGIVKGPAGSDDEDNGLGANLGLREQGSKGMSTWVNAFYNQQNPNDPNNGKFSFGAATAGITYELEINPQWGSSYSRATYVITVAADGTVTCSGTNCSAGFSSTSARNITVRLTQPNITGTLKTPVWNSAYSDLGIAQSEFDQTVQWGWVSLYKKGPMMGPGGWYGANTNEQGQFSFGGITEAGDYVLEYNPSWGSSFSRAQQNITISSEVAAGASLPLGTVRLSLPQLRGTVVKPDGTTAVQNAWIQIFNPSDWSIQPQGSNTDFNGRFSIGGLTDNTTYNLEVNMPWGQGLIAPSNLTVTLSSGVGVVKQGGLALTNNKITLQYPTNTLSGWVKKSGTTAVSNARVEAHKDMGGGFVETRTDGSGNYSMKLGDGSWWVGVRPDWGSDIDWTYSEPPTRITFTGSQSKTQNFSVSATNATIYGYVKKPDGTAVNNVWVDICQDKGMCNGRSTDSNGRFSIKVSAGTYRVSAFPPGELMNTFGAPDKKIVTVAANQSADAGTLTLKTKNSHIKGIVQDQAGNPVSNVVVNVHQFNEPGWGMSFTDTTGSYDVTVSAGTWMVMVMPMSNQYVYQGGPLKVTVLASETKSDNNFTLKLADSTIKGKVRLSSTSGDVVTDLWGGVWIKDTSVDDMLDFGGPMGDMMEKSGMMGGDPSAGGGPMGPGMMDQGMGTGINNGAFQLKVPAGTYEIGLGTPPGSPYTLSQTATVTVLSDSDPNNTLGYTNVNLVVVLNDKIISGHFYKDENSNNSYDSGEEVSGLRAMVQANKDGGGWQMSQSGSDGSYSLNVSSGTWLVDAFIDPFMSFGASQYMVVSPQEKLTITGNTTLNFKVKELNATISGTVTDPDGAGMSGVWVFADFGSTEMLADFKGPGGPGIGGFTDINGNYSIKVAGGTYKIGAGIPYNYIEDFVNPDLIPVTVASGATSSDNDLQFKASNATISGSITLNGSSQAGYVRAWSDSGRGTGTATATGNYSLKVVQGDTWHLVAVAKVNNALYQSAEATVVVDSATETQNLALVSLGLTVPEAKSVSFDASTTKTLTLTDGLTLEMPAGSIATSGTVTVTVTPTVDVKPDSKEKPIGITYNFSAKDSDSRDISDLAQNVTITMPYNEDLITAAGYSEDSITPKYYDETRGTWENYDTVIRDTENNRLIIVTGHFSDGGLVGGGGVPTAPSNLSATVVSGSRITLSWTDNSANETGFKIYRNGTRITTTAADVTSYTDTGLSAGTAYSYYVKATSASGDSAASNTVSATTQSGAGGGFDFTTPSDDGAAPAEKPTPVPEPTSEEEALPVIPVIPTLEKPISEMTVEELRAKISEFLTAIEQLKALLAQITPTPTVVGIPTDYKFEAILKQGQTSIDIKYLQIFLNSDPATRLTETGAGSPGQETTYFGPLTKAAVIKFQEKHASDILAPWDLTQGTGLVGKTTRAKINALLGR